jgi:putative DNA primase/helicase
MKVTAKMVSAVETLARSDPRLVMTTGQFDVDPWLFNVDNGTVEMKTGQLREHRGQDYITKLAGCAIAPHGALCPLWMAFLVNGHGRSDWELIDYLQRVCGSV